MNSRRKSHRHLLRSKVQADLAVMVEGQMGDKIAQNSGADAQAQTLPVSPIGAPSWCVRAGGTLHDWPHGLAADPLYEGYGA
jgi:hypothetical protein